MGKMNQFLQSNQQKVSDYLQEVGVMIHGATSLPQRQVIIFKNNLKFQIFSKFFSLFFVLKMVNEVERRAAFDVVHRLAHQHVTNICF